MSQLTNLDREIIEIGLRTKVSYRSIGRHIGRDHTVVMKEVKRNSGRANTYSAKTAEILRDMRKHRKRKTKLDKDPRLKKYVKERLKEGWSPEQISGRLKTHPSELLGLSISPESIYQYIYFGEDRYLYKYLRQKRKTRRFKHTRRSKISIPKRISIHERPSIVELKTRLGDWESDSMLFCRGEKQRLSVQYERKSQFIRINRLLNGSSGETELALLNTVASLPQYLFKTMTFDNGKENVGHIRLHDFYITTYFCDGYKAWQKGGVEHINSFIREYLPRNINLPKITDSFLKEIEDKLNNRPRKLLNYKTPAEVINSHINLGGAFLT